MLRELIESAAAGLKEGFGENCTVYYNEAPQEATGPFFIILPLKAIRTPRLGRRYYQTCPLDIQFIPGQEDKGARLMAVAERMMELLTLLTTENGERFLGRNMSFEVQRGTLHFYVSYNFFLLRPEEREAMESAKIDIGI